MSLPAAYKPSPLSFGSPRSSPFRRPESPATSPSTVVHRATPTTPTASRYHTPTHSPEKSYGAAPQQPAWSPRPLTPTTTNEPRPLPQSPTRGGTSGAVDLASTTQYRGDAGGNALSKLQAPQVQQLREAFQLLDRDSDGQVGREDVVYMLNNLGQDASPSALASFFPPGSHPTLSLPSFLTQLSNLLAPLSPADELTSAFAAFDDDDSGQVDLAELRDALLHTAPDEGGRVLSAREVDGVLASFSGRKTFGGRKNTGPASRGEVFKYQDFVSTVLGGNTNAATAGDQERGVER